MILIESKCCCFIAPDRLSIGEGASFRLVAFTFVLLVQIVGRLASTDTMEYLVDPGGGGGGQSDPARDKIPIGSIHRTDRFMRDMNDKSGINANSNNMNLPYQNRRDSGGRLPRNNPETNGFLGKFQTMPLTTRIVRTKYGDLSGVILTLDSRHLEPVEVFRGVPYAMPPTGSLRFMPPVSGALWSGVKYADKFSPVCPQRLPDISNETLALKKMPKGRLDYLKRLLPYLQNQSEDCLYLNIYAPAQAGSRESSGSKKYPVLLFIHGESYEWNSGNPYDGSVLASYGGVVVVTINYRLGILGFLNSNTDSYLRSPANYGLMDQIAALHWIQENIAVFGGDPTNVTVLGHGTGAACVNFLMASSAVPDGMLFHRAILMSGGALGPWALVQNPVRYAHQVAKHANCSPDLPHPHLLKCLRDRPLELLLSTPIETPEFSPVFGPSIDGVVIDSNEYSEDTGMNSRYGEISGYNEIISNPTKSGSPESENGAGGTNSVPNSVILQKNAISRLERYDLLLGVVRAESYFAFNAEDVQYGIEGDRRAKILKTFVKENYRYHLSEILATIVNEYTDWERPVQHPINIRDETLEALSDAMYVAPVVHMADLHSTLKRNNFLYVFDYQTKFGDYPQRQGCIHGEELPYIFGAPLVGGFSHFARNYTKSEMLLSEATMIYWSNFARTGNPNEPQDADLGLGVRQERNRFKNIEWIAYEGVHKKYLNLDTKPKVKNHFRAHRLSFWLKLVPDLHRPGGEDVPMTHHLLSEDDVAHDVLVHTHDSSKTRTGNQQQKKIPSGTVIEVTGKQSTVTGTINLNHQFDLNNTENTLFSVRGLHPLETIISNNVAASASASASPPQQEDGFAAYSTALSVTIAIGCSLLIVNVLIFAGVYYQRDKNRMNRHHHHHRLDGTGVAQGSEASNPKTIIENGIPNSICGDILLNSEVCKSGEPDVGNFGHIHHHIHHQLPLPDYADLSNNANLPRGSPPRVKHQKLTPCGVPKVRESQNFGTLPRSNIQPSIQYSVGTLPRSAQKTAEPVQSLRVLTPASSLKKKGQVLTNSGSNDMDELRV